MSSVKMTVEDKKILKALWETFYVKEKSFLAWLNESAEVLLDINASSPMFTPRGDAAIFGYDLIQTVSGSLLSKPPRYIRKCITFTSVELFNECQHLSSEVVTNYRAAALLANGVESIRLPQRFPIFFSNVSQINYSSDDAFSSKLVGMDGRFTIYSGFFDQGFLDTCKDLEFKTIEIVIENAHMDISLDCAEIRECLGCPENATLHCRRNTGTQYTSRILFGNAQPAFRSKFGLMVIDPDNHPSCFQSPPRKKRSDTIELNSREVFLPFPTNSRFFISDSCHEA